MAALLALPMLALAAAAAQTAPAAPRPAPPPGNLADYLTGNDYPPEAMRRGHQGTVAFTVTVAPNGRVTDCLITRSSGHESLDSGTCRLARRRLRFNPARARGKAVEAQSRPFRIVWRLPEGNPGPGQVEE